MKKAAQALSLVLAAAVALGASATESPSAAQKKRKKDKEPPRKMEPWLGDLDAAREESLARNAPILVLAILEGEETSDRVREEIYHGKEFLAASEGTIVLLVNNGTHTTKKVKVKTADGKEVERSVCSLYHTPSCADHQRSMDRVYQEFHENGDFKMPHLLAILPNGKIHDRAKDEIQIADSVRLAEAVKKKAGPSLSALELDEVRGKLDALISFQKARLWVDAWRAGTRVLEITQVPHYAEPARLGVEAALAGMRGDVDAAVKLIEGGDVERGYAKLLGLRDEHAATPVEKETKDRLKKIERDKRYKDAIKLVKRRMEAEEIWDQVRKAQAAGKQKTAERHAKKLIDRFGDTPAGARAKESFPHLVGTGG